MRRGRNAGAADACPCDSLRTYVACCGPYHAREREAPDAETLMRSRYTAFARGDAEYVWHTLHPDHDDRARPRDQVIASLRESAARSRFERLRVLDVTAPDADGVARVLFAVNLRYVDRDASFIECSDFVRANGGWRYLQGENAPLRPLASQLHTLRVPSFLAWRRALGAR